jgi:dTDP-4-dehydrorhamnose reductase
MLKFAMSTISVLGASGMLGSGLVDYLHTREFQVIEINRSDSAFYQTSTHIKFDAGSLRVDEIVSELPIGSLLINCVGVIKHKIDLSNPKSVESAIRINSILPVALALACRERDISIIQVATDCVYSGMTGNYSEVSAKDPQDIYGLTKSAGELDLENVMTLRCSLVGKERDSQIEFLEWILSHPRGSELSGFTNHFWNGVTVLDIAKFIEGVLSEKFFRRGIHHFVPADSISKHGLAQLVSSEFGRDDLYIREIDAAQRVNRVLATQDSRLNEEFWRIAQYNHVPTIKELISNYALWINQNRR